MALPREEDFRSDGWGQDFLDLRDRFEKKVIIGKGTYG